VSKQSGRVVDLASSDPNEGATIQIWDWNGGTNQQWQIDGDGFIRSMMNQYVLNVSGGSTQPGTLVISWPQQSTNNANEQWTTDF
jgi:ricin-type beta-trefoil lectin protein